VRRRGVFCYLGPETATATITAEGLPPDEAAAACARLDRLAEQVLRAGHPGCRHQITADLYLGMLDGRWHGHTEQQIIADLLFRRPRSEDQPAPTGQPAEPEQPAGREQSAVPMPVTRGIPPDAPDRRPARPQNASATESTAVEPQPEPITVEQSAAEPPVVVEPVASIAPTTPARAGIEIRVGLATLLGRDDRPGEIPGLGPVTAETARTAVAAQHRGAQWRFAVVDDEGYLLLAGVTRRRPWITTSDPPPLVPVRGGIAELHVPATLLSEMAADPAACGEWAGVVADLAGQYARCDQLLTALDGKPGARFARGALARHIQVRDRSCCHMGCQCPAAAAELDHTRDHVAGGPTSTANIDPACERHHWYKTALGWRLRQPEPGQYQWISPLGQVYRTRGEPIRPDLPDPLPHAPNPDERAPAVDEFDYPDRPILDRKLKKPDPPPREPPPPRPPPDDEPRRSDQDPGHASSSSCGQ
jgi:hypothetical protein